jgi:hypothetical protein
MVSGVSGRGNDGPAKRPLDGIGRGKRVLVVNDTQEILELFDELLSELGFEVQLMSFAPRELQRVREAQADLILLDIVFGQREPLGWQLLQKIKMDRDLDSTPIIVCTAAAVFTFWINSPPQGQKGVVSTILISVGLPSTPSSTFLIRSRSTMLIPISGS